MKFFFKTGFTVVSIVAVVYFSSFGIALAKAPSSKVPGSNLAPTGGPTVGPVVGPPIGGPISDNPIFFPPHYDVDENGVIDPAPYYDHTGIEEDVEIRLDRGKDRFSLTGDAHYNYIEFRGPARAGNTIYIAANEVLENDLVIPVGYEDRILIDGFRADELTIEQVAKNLTMIQDPNGNTYYLSNDFTSRLTEEANQRWVSMRVIVNGHWLVRPPWIPPQVEPKVPAAPGIWLTNVTDRDGVYSPSDYDGELFDAGQTLSMVFGNFGEDNRDFIETFNALQLDFDNIEALSEEQRMGIGGGALFALTEQNGSLPIQSFLDIEFSLDNFGLVNISLEDTPWDSPADFFAANINVNRNDGMENIISLDGKAVAKAITDSEGNFAKAVLNLSLSAVNWVWLAEQVFGDVVLGFKESFLGHNDGFYPGHHQLRWDGTAYFIIDNPEQGDHYVLKGEQQVLNLTIETVFGDWDLPPTTYLNTIDLTNTVGSIVNIDTDARSPYIYVEDINNVELLRFDVETRAEQRGTWVLDEYVLWPPINVDYIAMQFFDRNSGTTINVRERLKEMLDYWNVSREELIAGDIPLLLGNGARNLDYVMQFQRGLIFESR